jgi:RNA polymerase sigma-70 factor (ECF subfamily)
MTNLFEETEAKRFERLMLPHLDAAYNHARWLLKDAQDAEDVVQDSYLKAFRHFSTYRGGSAKGWLLAIVRNTAYNALRKKNLVSSVMESDADIESVAGDDHSNMSIDHADDVSRVNDALGQLPLEYREVIVLRELEEFSYKEIATMTELPIGTVMSRISRGRERLRILLKKGGE